MNLVAWKMVGVKDFVDRKKGVQKIELKKQEGVWKALVKSKSQVFSNFMFGFGRENLRYFGYDFLFKI
jgi:hypothetical protein